MKMKINISIVAALFACAVAEAGTGELVNGGVWKDSDGVHINAHGGGLLKDGGVWYWYGEHKTAGKEGNRANVGVSVYSSSDLLTWKREGVALAVTEGPSDIEKGCILERPKVVKSRTTGRYAMLFHLERKGNGYNDARVGFAVAEKATGPFKFLRSENPLGGMSRDMTIFTDDDGTSWHVFASENNATLHFAELTPDCLGYTGKVHRNMERHWTEAPCVVKHDGWYYLLGSGCTGWKPNAARMYRAKSLGGPWEWLCNPCTGVNPENRLGADKTWGGQSTYIFRDEASGRDIACFDLWRPSNAIDGRYAWLPIDWSDPLRPEIAWRDTWSPAGAGAASDTLRGGPASVWGVYQWGVEVEGFVHNETKKPARAYLWIPPRTKTVKSVVIGNDNMLEEPLFSDPDFRRTLAADDTAIVFVTPGLQGFNVKFSEADVPAVDALLAKLAKASGHPELAGGAKLVPLGHSAWADWPYMCTAAMPGRVKCAVSLKGSWPHFKPEFDDDFWARTAGVPMLLVGGEYEWFTERMEKEKPFLKAHPDVKLLPVPDWESGHFDMTDALPLAIARFITKGEVPRIPRSGGKFSVVGFLDREGKVVAQDPKSHLQVTVPFQPDGEGFAARAVFDEKVPAGRPERWTGLKAGSDLQRPELPREAIDVKVVQGPAVKRTNDAFDIRFNRHGFDGYRAREVVLAAVYPGDAHWKRSVQQAILRFPVNTHGAENAIEWSAPEKVRAAEFPLKLTATASSGLPVRYFVREGPAVVGDDGVLALRDWPEGAASAEVTVCAYQWGADGGKVKTAEPVYRTIRIFR